jgi:hypothetical protein
MLTQVFKMSALPQHNHKLGQPLLGVNLDLLMALTKLEGVRNIY